VFHGRKPEVYDSWGVCSEYVASFSGAAFQSYLIMIQAEEAYVAFLEDQNTLWKSEQVA
jgi:viroplasmin and RNaseH domain-containing protein